MDARSHDNGAGGLAEVRFGLADFTVVKPGAYVVCAITGKRIPLEELRYWSAERQEAYVDAVASLAAHQAHRRAGPADE